MGQLLSCIGSKSRPTQTKLTRGLERSIGNREKGRRVLATIKIQLIAILPLTCTLLI